MRFAFTAFLVCTHISKKTRETCLTMVTNRKCFDFGVVVEHHFNISFTVLPPCDIEEARDRCRGGGDGGGDGGSNSRFSITGYGRGTGVGVVLRGGGSLVEWIRCCLI